MNLRTQPAFMVRHGSQNTQDRPKDATRRPPRSAREWVRVLVDRLVGTRFIDIPLRVLALLIAISAVLPGATEGHEPLYLFLFYASSLLLVLSAFFPASTAAVVSCLFLVHILVYPEYLNPFHDSLEFASVVLLATGRWRLGLATVLTALGLTWMAQQIQPNLAMSFTEFAFAWGLSSTLALSGLLLEHRIRREIDSREKAAVAHDHDSQRMRLNFAVDAHDTISHGLATQAAVLRILAREDVDPGVRRKLGELAMLNDQTQQNLRTLLYRLRTAQDIATPAPSPRGHLLQALDSLASAGAAGGYDIHLDVMDPPSSLSSTLSEQTLAITRELVTNMVKHSSSRQDCAITIQMHETPDGIRTLIESTNPSSNAAPVPPMSLATRVGAIGGTCLASHDDGRYQVTISLPASPAITHPSPEG